MPLLRDADRKAIQERLEQSLRADVKVRLFTQSDVRSMLTIPGQPQQTNEYAKVTKELLQELDSLSPKLSLEVLDIHGDGAAEAKRLNIEQVPAIVLGDDSEGRVRFYGAPVGNEFATILTSIEGLSQSTPPLQEHVAKVAQEHIDEAVHLRVFVTPT
jgi:alkyl hydroperoxide reductase subunit AhpF